MSKQYWIFNEETLIINQNGLPITTRAEQDYYPRTALLKKPLAEKDGYQVLAVLDENGCAIDSEYTEDHREKTIYNTQDCRQSKTVEKLGTIEDGWTLLKPLTQFDEWIDDAWVTNEQAQRDSTLVSSISAIDNKAGVISAYWLRFAEEYKERESAALAYKAAGYTGDVSIYISSFAQPAGLATQTATDLILQQAEGLRSLQSQLSVERMRKYELNNESLSIEDIESLTAEICANMQALADSHE